MGSCWHCGTQVTLGNENTKCPTCQVKEHPIESDCCSQCIKQRGNNKGQPFKLKLCKSDKDTCRFDRNDYQEIKKEVEEDGDIKGSD